MFQVIDEAGKLLSTFETQPTDFDHRKGFVTFWHGFAKWTRYGYTDVRPIIEDSKELFGKADSPIGLGMVNVALGVLDYIKGSTDTALDKFNIAISQFERKNNIVRINWAKEHKGVSYRFRGDYEKAIAIHQETLKAMEQIGHKLMTASILLQLGVDYQAQGNPDRGLEYHERSLELSRGISKWVAEALDAISLIYEQRRNFDSALDYAYQYHEIWKNMGNKTNIA